MQARNGRPALDDRIDNAFTEWRSLPWYKRWWEWFRG